MGKVQLKVQEVAGFAAGVLFAPIAAAVAYVRRARTFHPRGVVYRAQVVAAATEGAAADVAARLSGPALVRLSAGLRKRQARGPDLLGVAVRFRRNTPITPEPERGDQDMLFATARRAVTLIPALFTTDVHNFLGNDYYAISLFDAGELGLTRWRLVTPRIPDGEGTREEDLHRAVVNGQGVLELQVREARLGARYEPVAQIRLIERVDLDQEALAFSPFRDGRGIVARGFLNAMRIVPYPVSQRVRARRR